VSTEHRSFAATVFIGELGCLLVYSVQTYQQLYACRVLTGISICGTIPIAFSVLGDVYHANQRSIVAAVVTTGSGLGMGIGQVIAAMLNN
jgi:MFS family permease